MTMSPNRFIVSGPVLVDNASAVERAGREAIVADKREIDFADVTDVDSAGVAVVLSWLRLARQRGDVISFFNLPDNIRSLAAVYGVAELLPS